MSADDQAMMNLGECIRGYISAQDTSSWFKNCLPFTLSEAESLFIPFDRALTPDEVASLRTHGECYDLHDLIDSGFGVTLTTLGGTLSAEELESALQQSTLQLGIRRILPESCEPYCIHTESGFHDFRNLWGFGEGSGATTRYLLGWVDKTSHQLRVSFDQSTSIPKVAIGHIERDAEWASKWGPPRADIQNARAIIGGGTGWLDRLRQALVRGESLPAIMLALWML